MPTIKKDGNPPDELDIIDKDTRLRIIRGHPSLMICPECRKHTFIIIVDRFSREDGQLLYSLICASCGNHMIQFWE